MLRLVLLPLPRLLPAPPRPPAVPRLLLGLLLSRRAAGPGVEKGMALGSRRDAAAVVAAEVSRLLAAGEARMGAPPAGLDETLAALLPSALAVLLGALRMAPPPTTVGVTVNVAWRRAAACMAGSAHEQQAPHGVKRTSLLSQQ